MYSNSDSNDHTIFWKKNLILEYNSDCKRDTIVIEVALTN